MIRSFLNWMLPPLLALALLSLGSIAPISDLWDKVFSWIAVAVILVYLAGPMRDYHRAKRAAAQSSSTPISPSDPT